jgi:hypothetical protein
MDLVRNEADIAIPGKDSMDFLFEDLVQQSRKLTPSQVYSNEINIYQSLVRPGSKTDPLQWWKSQSFHMPYLGTHHKT